MSSDRNIKKMVLKNNYAFDTLNSSGPWIYTANVLAVDKTTGSENTVRVRAVSNLRNGDINVSPISTLTAALVDDEIASSTASISSIISKSETKAAIAFGIDVADLKVDPYQSDRADLVGISTNIQIAVKSFVNASLDPKNPDAVSNAIGSLANEVV